MPTFFTFIIALILFIGLSWLLDKFVVNKLDKTKLFSRMIIGLYYSISVVTSVGIVVAIINSILFYDRVALITNAIAYALIMAIVIMLINESISKVTFNGTVIMVADALALGLFVILMNSFESKDELKFYPPMMTAIYGLFIRLYAIDYPKQIAENKSSE